MAANCPLGRVYSALCPLIGTFDDDLSLHLRKHVGGFEMTDTDKEGFTTELMTCSPVMYLDAASCERNQVESVSQCHGRHDRRCKVRGRQGLYAYAELFT